MKNSYALSMRGGGRFLAYLFLFFVVTPCFHAQAGVYGEYRYRMKVRFAGYDKPETLTNFQALVTLGTNIPDFRYSRFNSASTGADLRFASSNETTELNYEIEKWNTNGNSYVWVQVPALASSNDYIYAYWGNAVNAAPCTTNGSTWNPTDLAVYHFGDTNGVPDGRDFTANGRHATIVGTTNVPGGIIGGAQGFSGNASVYVNGPATIVGYGISGSFTLSVWFRTHVDNTQCLLSDGEGYYDAYGYLFLGTSGQVHQSLYNSGGGGVTHDNIPINYTLDQWHTMSQRYDGSTVQLFYDGVLKDTLSLSGTVKNGSRNLLIGKRGDGNAINGEMDEVRISSQALSPNWIYTCWLNQASNSTFVTFSSATLLKGTVILVK